MGAFALFLLTEIVPLLVKGVPGALAAFEWGRDRVKEMVDNDRGPSDEEQAELDRRTNDLRRRLHSDDE